MLLERMQTYNIETDFSDKNIFQIIAATMVGKGGSDPLQGFILSNTGCVKLAHTKKQGEVEGIM